MVVNKLSSGPHCYIYITAKNICFSSDAFILFLDLQQTNLFIQNNLPLPHSFCHFKNEHLK